MRGLVLSLFPGVGMFDCGFEEAFAVVRGPDPLWGGRIQEFHPPSGRFDGVIGGPPCQAFSSLANLVRAKGLEPKWGNLIPEFSRCIEEAQPEWFVMENVPKAPEPKPLGYSVTSFLLDNCWLGEAQMRKRRFSFGWNRKGEAPNLRRWIPGVAFELPDPAPAVTDHAPGDVLQRAAKQQAVAADSRAVPVKLGGSGKVKATAVSREDTPQTRMERGSTRWSKQAPATGRHDGADGASDKDYSPPRRTIGEMLELQGFPPDWMDHQPWTMQVKRSMVGNGVSRYMAEAVARAVGKALECGIGS